MGAHSSYSHHNTSHCGTKFKIPENSFIGHSGSVIRMTRGRKIRNLIAESHLAGVGVGARGNSCEGLLSKQNKGSCQYHQGFNSEDVMETYRRTIAFKITSGAWDSGACM